MWRSFLLLVLGPCLALEIRTSVLPLAEDSAKPLDATANNSSWIVPKHFTHMAPRVARIKSLKDELSGFFRSARAASFVSFLMYFTFMMAASVLLHYRESRYWWQHIFTMAFWILMTLVFAAVLLAQESSEQMAEFGRGYFIELTLSLENVFVYEMILVSFRVPRRVAKDMLYVVSFFQMFFQLWLFMFMAKLLQGIESLPYLIGAWLLYLGYDTLKEVDDEDVFDPQTSVIYRMLTSPLGERLVPHYGDGALAITDRKTGRLQITMMAPVTFCLVLAMFWLELDVTLAKIEDINSNFIGWTSSVFVAFALPDIYFIVSEMFKHFRLLRPGVSILLMFFGSMLLLRNEVNISDNVEIICMLGIVMLSMLLSRFFNLPPKRGQPYDTTDKESEPSEPSEA